MAQDLISRLNAVRNEKICAVEDAWRNGGPNRGVLGDLLKEAGALERDAVYELVRLRAALRLCGKTFRDYEKLHLEKCTPSGDRKASANREMAEMCEALVQQAPSPSPASSNDGGEATPQAREDDGVEEKKP